MSKLIDADYFVTKAEQCFRLASLERDISNEIEAMGYEFMAKAVEFDTRRDKSITTIKQVRVVD
jgi:hypothetical protein